MKIKKPRRGIAGLLILLSLSVGTVWLVMTSTGELVIASSGNQTTAQVEFYTILRGIEISAEEFQANVLPALSGSQQFQTLVQPISDYFARKILDATLPGAGATFVGAWSMYRYIKKKRRR